MKKTLFIIGLLLLSACSARPSTSCVYEKEMLTKQIARYCTHPRLNQMDDACEKRREVTHEQVTCFKELCTNWQQELDEICD